MNLSLPCISIAFIPKSHLSDPDLIRPHTENKPNPGLKSRSKSPSFTASGMLKRNFSGFGNQFILVSSEELCLQHSSSQDLLGKKILYWETIFFKTF